MAEWVRAASLEEIPPGTAKEVHAGDRIVALFNVQGTLYAIDGICPHQGGPLGQGALEDKVVTCPWHGYQFDVPTGRNVANPQLQQETIPVRLEGEDVLVWL